MGSQSRRLALIIASSHYTDKTLTQLVAPGQDAGALTRALADPAIGNFDTKELIDRPSHEVRREIEAFFANRRRDDLLLLYFSGHGIKSDDGRLYLATIDTERHLPLATTVPASFVNETMTVCNSRRQVLILDCCHSGAFATGMVAKGGDCVDIQERFEGQGRVVLTASNSIQYAFEGDKISGAGARSVFTRHLVHGLETGDADLDGDGFISLAELYDYIYARQVDETPNQRPGMWAFKVEGELFLARSPRGLRPQGAEEGQLAEQYRQALAALSAGRWQEAHTCLETLAAQRPHYQDVAERVQPLRRLALQMKRLGPSSRGWRLVVARFPILIALLAIVLPNALASVFNYNYNLRTIVLTDENRHQVFYTTAAIVNSVGFPLGLAIFLVLAQPVVRGLRQLRQGLPLSREDLQRLRSRILHLGHYAALIGVSLWVLAGPVYPVSIHLWGGTMALSDYAYFTVSLCLGGLIAAAYPFFGVTFLFVRVLYPPLVQPGSTTAEDRALLQRLDGFAWRYLLLAVSVPMLALALALLVNRSQSESELLAQLSLGGLAGSVLAFWLFRTLQSDLEILMEAVTRSRPGREGMSIVQEAPGERRTAVTSQH